jgi:hypothetical protein
MAAHTAVAGLGLPMAIGLVLIALFWTTVTAGISYINHPGHKMTAKSSIIAVVKAGSPEECIVSCRTTPGCQSVSFQKTANVCQTNCATVQDEYAVITPDVLWDTWSPNQTASNKKTTRKKVIQNYVILFYFILFHFIFIKKF